MFLSKLINMVFIFINFKNIFIYNIINNMI